MLCQCYFTNLANLYEEQSSNQSSKKKCHKGFIGIKNLLSKKLAQLAVFSLSGYWLARKISGVQRVQAGGTTTFFYYKILHD